MNLSFKVLWYVYYINILLLKMGILGILVFIFKEVILVFRGVYLVEDIIFGFFVNILYDGFM